MKYPQMIIFDQGHTLLYEPGWDSVKGNAELLKYVTKNPNNCTLNDVVKGAELIFGKNIEKVRSIGYEISGQIANRVLYEYLGMEFSLTPLEMESVFWDGVSAGAVMPGADQMIDYLNKKGIRSAVISNLLWSSEALTKRLNRLLPNNRFEFVITSSDYFMRKPNPILFEIALKKSGGCAEKMFGTAVIIRKPMWKVLHKWACSLFYMIMMQIKNLKKAAIIHRYNASIYISTNGKN